MPRISSLDRLLPEMIRDRKPFQTHGALRAESVDGLNAWNSGELDGADLERFRTDVHLINYVVYSYNTPIAWFVGSGVGWYRVQAKFSTTTSKHQGRLYLIPREGDRSPRAE